METKWRQYETLMIFDPDLGTEGTEDHIRRARDYIGQEEGRIVKTERWGAREMAFELKGRRKGYYFLVEYAGVPRVATELDRRLNLIDTVLKFQTIKTKDKVDPATLPELEEEVVPAAAAAETPAKAPTPAKGSEDADEGEDTDETDETED